jgi:hypothetical protein
VWVEEENEKTLRQILLISFSKFLNIFLWVIVSSKRFSKIKSNNRQKKNGIWKKKFFTVWSLFKSQEDNLL